MTGWVLTRRGVRPPSLSNPEYPGLRDLSSLSFQEHRITVKDKYLAVSEGRTVSDALDPPLLRQYFRDGLPIAKWEVAEHTGPLKCCATHFRNRLPRENRGKKRIQELRRLGERVR